MQAQNAYTVSVPVLIHRRTDPAAILSEIRRAGADRLFLAVDVLSAKPEKNTEMLQTLSKMIPFFKKNGIETGVWFWTFWRADLDDVSEEWVTVEADGTRPISDTAALECMEHSRNGFCCPANPDFVTSATQLISDIARTGPDILMFDDDFKLGSFGGKLGCYCNAHIAAVNQKLGKALTREALAAKIWEGKPNPERSAWMRANGESMESFAREVRRAVDGVNPSIRIALCTVMSVWDHNGTSPQRLAKLLAGKTKPLMRLICAPYWAPPHSFDCTLSTVIDQERMEYAWCCEEEIEVMTEGDTYPRPRDRVPAAYLESFDTTLRTAGVGNGILKYLLDYASSPTYETGYTDRHLRHAELYRSIASHVADKHPVGVRVLEVQHKVENADVSGIPNPALYTENLFFSAAAQLLSGNSIPITFTGDGIATAAFGENAHALDDTLLSGGVILDRRAARILAAKGIDVGVRWEEMPVKTDTTYFPIQNETVNSGWGEHLVYPVTPADGAVVLSYACSGERQYPDVIRYKNARGQRFLILSSNVTHPPDGRYLNYCMQKMLPDAIEWLAEKPLPAVCPGHPQLYLLTAQNQSGATVLGLWNNFADEILAPTVTLAKDNTNAEFLHGTGILQGNKLLLSDIPPFGFALVELK